MLKSFDDVKPETQEELSYVGYIHSAKRCLDELVELGIVRIGTQRRACRELNSALSVVSRDLGRPFYRSNKNERNAQIKAAAILKEQNIKDNETKLDVLNAERENVEKENRD